MGTSEDCWVALIIVIVTITIPKPKYPVTQSLLSVGHRGSITTPRKLQFYEKCANIFSNIFLRFLHLSVVLLY